MKNKELIEMIVEIKVSLADLKTRIAKLEDPLVDWPRTYMNFSHRLTDLEGKDGE